MGNEIMTRLKDIEQAILEINSFIPEVKKFENFQRDLKTERAVERNIEIIGEAMTRILKAEPNVKITNTRKIIDTKTELFIDMTLFPRRYYGE